MKKLLVLMLVLGLASAASATVIDVVAVGPGSMGNAGTMEDPLEVGETIGLKIVLNANAYAGYPSYDGYVLSSMDLSLDVIGAASLDAVTKDKTGNPVWKYNAGLSPFVVNDDGTVANGLDQITAVALTPVGGSDSIANDLMWELILTCTGQGEVVIDLGLNGLTEYAEFSTPTGANFGDWLAAVEADLGDLVIYQAVPEPMTIALLGLGGLLLRRRK